MISTGKITNQKVSTPYEDVIFDDKSIPLQEGDREGQLNEIIELQERMASGMKMIQHYSAKRQEYYDAYNVPMFRKCRDYVRTLWVHWQDLKAECDVIIGTDRKIWVDYFSLAQEDINTYFTYNGEGETLEANRPDSRMCDTVDIYADTHIAEMAYDDRKITVGWLPSYCFDHKADYDMRRKK